MEPYFELCGGLLEEEMFSKYLICVHQDGGYSYLRSMRVEIAWNGIASWKAQRGLEEGVMRWKVYVLMYVCTEVHNTEQDGLSLTLNPRLDINYEIEFWKA